MPFPILPSNSATGYNLTRSVRLRGSATGYLSRTPASAGNRQTWTYSAWIKRGNVNAEATIVSGATSGRLNVFFDSTGRLISDVGGTGTFDQSTAVYRDPSAWYHFVWQFDTTQATAANRSRMYINGVQVSLTQVRTFAQNTNYGINTADLQTIGTFSNSIGTYNFDGYTTEINFIDGQSLTPTSFGLFNSLTGVWQPRRYAGTYGTNGYYLPFTNNSTTTTLGNDFSGNSNNWTTNNISLTAGVTYDSMTDVPTLTSATTANYATLNFLTFANFPALLQDGNLSYREATGSATWKSRWSTIAMPSKKWYAEVYCTYSGTNALATNAMIGLHDGLTSTTYIGQSSTSYGYNSNGNKWNNNTSTSFGASWGNGDLIQIAYEPSSGKVWFGKNGTWQASGDPAAGTNPAYTGVPANLYFGVSGFWVSPDGTTWFYANFGQRPFAYTPPTGFVALNTFNLPTSTIVKGNTVMNATTYTGNGTGLGSTQTISNGNFQPDFIWIKSRGTADYHNLNDSVRGIVGTGSPNLFSNTTDAETTFTGYGVSAVTSTGFTLIGNGSYTNNNGTNYVAWQWQSGQGTNTTNTTGSITSTVSVNPTAGFSIATFTTPVSGTATIGHGLGIAPSMIITKGRATVTSWTVYHASTGNTGYTSLNQTAAFFTDANAWNNTTPTSSVFTIGTSFNNLGTYVAYCWSEIAGFSKFGGYTGNGSTDGPFIYTGFRPRFVMFKTTNTIGNWFIFDTARNTTNQMDLLLLPNSAAAESNAYGSYYIDFVSNGFKIRGNGSAYNASGDTMIYAAFAENPFKNALAR